MENNFSLLISDVSLKDLEGIFSYISENLSNPSAAKKLAKDFNDAFINLRNFPFSYPIVNVIFIKEKNIRRMIVNIYVVFYKIEEKEITILRIRHATTNYLI